MYKTINPSYNGNYINLNLSNNFDSNDNSEKYVNHYNNNKDRPLYQHFQGKKLSHDNNRYNNNGLNVANNNQNTYLMNHTPFNLNRSHL